jgi:hypothetical protein
MRSFILTILFVAVVGIAPNTTCFGTLKRAMRLRQKAMSSLKGSG